MIPWLFKPAPNYLGIFTHLFSSVSLVCFSLSHHLVVFKSVLSFFFKSSICFKLVFFYYSFPLCLSIYIYVLTLNYIKSRIVWNPDRCLSLLKKKKILKPVKNIDAHSPLHKEIYCAVKQSKAMRKSNRGRELVGVSSKYLKIFNMWVGGWGLLKGETVKDKRRSWTETDWMSPFSLKAWK